MPTVTGIKDFDGSIGATQEWIDGLTARLGWHDREKVYLALIATLHSLRDSLPIHEAVFLGDWLPITLRAYIATQELTPNKSPKQCLLCLPTVSQRLSWRICGR